LIFWRNTLLRDANGTIIGTFSSCEDITDRVRAEEKIKSYSRNLEILNRIITITHGAQKLLTLLHDVIDFVVDYLGHDGGGIYLVDESEGNARLACHRGFPEDFIEEAKQVNIHDKSYKSIFFEKKPIAVDYSTFNPERSKNGGCSRWSESPYRQMEK
jgi:hypothetical protein